MVENADDDIWLSLDKLVEQRRQRLARKAAETADQAAQDAEEARRYRDAFMSYRLGERDRQAIMRRIRDAFEAGNRELMLFKFPSALCSDGGRAINNAEAGWPDTLPGAAREVYEFWRDHLRNRGFGLSARIVDFPGGFPGDVGVIFDWPDAV